MEPIPPLLPPTIDLQFDASWVDGARHEIILALSSIQAAAACPCCRFPSNRVHSRYARTIADLPWADFTVRLQLAVRKFRCDNEVCDRQIFCERLPSVVAPWARRTNRLLERQRHVGIALGGMAGARLSEHMNCTTSRNTLLRTIRGSPSEPPPTPHVLGVDDWAKCKGQEYGTIVVDLEEGRVIDLLPDREADTLAGWLSAHPGVELIARDRADAYADGARRGAPSAIQIADRFHLIHSLIDVLQQVFEPHRTRLTLPSAEIAGDHSRQESEASPVVIPLDDATAAAMTPALTVKGQARLVHYEQARELHAAGWTKSAIARHLGIRRHTVRRYIEAGAFPDRRHGSKLDLYKPYLIERWNGGCRTGKQLLEEIRQRGYRGGRSIAYAYITRLRRAQGLPPRSRMLPPGHTVSDVAAYRVTPRQAAFLVLRRPEKLREKDSRMIEYLEDAHPELKEALTLGRDYLRLVRERLVDEFDGWLARARESSLLAFRRFARSLRRDYEAVKAALVYPWSTSPVEGHINRLKLVKRQMYGRAKLDLLSKRVLYTA
ncbi:MAG TPA: ISL3 family transposase [Chloroflexota bacterium]|nr:ISL3 family transposase [Chloroflexota bacterium]